MNNRKRVLALVAILLLIAVIVMAVVFGQKRAQVETTASNVYVSTDQIVVKDLESVITTKGTVTAREHSEIFSELTSTVSGINVEEGDYVEAGQVVISLDTEALDKQIRDASLSLEISKLNYANALNTSSDDSQLLRAKNAYELALKDYENTKALYNSGAVSQREFEQSEYAFAEAEKSYTTAQDLTKSTSNNLKVMALDVESAENRLQDLQDQKSKAQIVATISGTVTSINVAENDIVTTSMPIAVIETIDSLEVSTYIGEYDINQVHLGQEVKISGYGVGNDVYDGKVTFIGASAEVQSVGQSTERSVLVKIEISGETAFKPNFTADVEIEVDKALNALAVPYEAIDYREGENYIFKVVDGIANQVPVSLGVQGEILIQVISDQLAEGDTIVLDPPATLTDGDNIKVIEGALK